MKSSVFEDLYKKKSPQDAVESISEMPNILLIMDQISKVTSDLRKVGIDVLQPAVSLHIFYLIFLFCFLTF